MKQKYLPGVGMPAIFVKGGVHYAAIITAVWSTVCVNLVVFGRADDTLREVDTRTSVVYGEDGAEGSWHFPEWLTDGPTSVEVVADDLTSTTPASEPSPAVAADPNLPAAAEPPVAPPTMAEGHHDDVARMESEGGTKGPQEGAVDA